VLQCVAVCCSVLQCVTVCCSVLQCVAVCCSVLNGVRWVSRWSCAVCCSVLPCVAVCCSVLQCVESCAIGVKVIMCTYANYLLQCVTVCYSVLQCVAVCWMLCDRCQGDRVHICQSFECSCAGTERWNHLTWVIKSPPMSHEIISYVSRNNLIWVTK